MVQVYALGSSRKLEAEVAAALGTEPGGYDEACFDDGERRIRPHASARGDDLVVLASVAGGADLSVHDELCRLLFLVGTLRDDGAASLTVVAPYLGYSRQDRKVVPRDPVSSRYVAELLCAMGTDAVVTVDVHDAAAFDNAHPRSLNLLPAELMCDALLPALDGARCVVVAPDAGAMHRAERVRRALAERTGGEVAGAVVEKHRTDRVVSDGVVVGDVAGATAVIVDDMVASGTTLVRAAAACRREGAAGVVAAITHGLFTRGAPDALADPVIDRIVVTDTIWPTRLGTGPAAAKLEVVSVAPLLAGAVVSLGLGRAPRSGAPGDAPRSARVPA
ncbi:MAG: ribose-phosphate pyrophosphokinase [Acidimicrobiales bacterium]|nr:ribose-phosphate pyrophosphokinase [Acidimicrobiales bacterium]